MHSTKLSTQDDYEQRTKYYGLQPALLVADDLVYISEILSEQSYRFINYNGDEFASVYLVNEDTTSTTRLPDELYYGLCSAPEKVFKCNGPV